ncbi:MAG: ATP synthase F0 subunit B [Actinobacteria bacterium]|nr:ATP synthase F0 subunit B [Actinomycetota bacterium]
MNIFILAEEGTHHANGWVLPGDINEVIWGTIGFLVVFTLILWKGGPAIKAMWNGRIDRIRTELDNAAASRSEAEAKLAAVEASLADADNERQRIVAEARDTAVTVRAQIIAKAGTDAADLRARGAADVEAAKAQATSDLQAEVAVLAIGAAEAVVANALDASTQSQLIDNYIDKVGA